jgi:hypothetical protein
MESPVTNRPRRRRLACAAAALLAAGLGGCQRGTAVSAPELEGFVTDSAPVRGRLLVSAYGPGPAAAAPTLHTTVWVDGPDYAGMEDNDLRGFLDGVFEYGWNQMGQSHVRVGRRGESPRFGEYEIFRNLHRWGGIVLPPEAVVRDAVLALEVEEPAPFPVRLLLYEVKRDWDPGNGGTQKNNVSPPVDGEVWWNDRAYGRAPWGLPGVGYASDADALADTGAMPLAEADWRPGDAALAFRSPRLARYVEARSREGLPLLFLVKLSDLQEDIPTSLITLYSANHGDSRSVARRPSLTLAWESRAERASAQHELLLEYGRRLELPRLEARGAERFAASFVAEGDGRRPTLEVRGGAAGEAGAWRRMPPVLSARWDWIELRVLAAEQPLALGTPFESEIHNTWVRTAAPEAQRVPWRFVSPSGVVHERLAEYQGNFRWRVHFVPDELGPWRYRWSDDFTERHFDSAEGRFDVVAGELEDVLRALAALRDELEGVDLARDPRRLRLMQRFSKLERAAMQTQTPASWSLGSGAELRHLLRELRGRLGGPVPEAIRLVADAPPGWAR